MKLEAQLEDYSTKVKEWEEKREDMKKKILDGGEPGGALAWRMIMLI